MAAAAVLFRSISFGAALLISTIDGSVPPEPIGSSARRIMEHPNSIVNPDRKMIKLAATRLDKKHWGHIPGYLLQGGKLTNDSFAIFAPLLKLEAATLADATSPFVFQMCTKRKYEELGTTDDEPGPKPDVMGFLASTDAWTADQIEFATKIPERNSRIMFTKLWDSLPESFLVTETGAVLGDFEFVRKSGSAGESAVWSLSYYGIEREIIKTKDGEREERLRENEQLKAFEGKLELIGEGLSNSVVVCNGKALHSTDHEFLTKKFKIGDSTFHLFAKCTTAACHVMDLLQSLLSALDNFDLKGVLNSNFIEIRAPQEESTSTKSVFEAEPDSTRSASRRSIAMHEEPSLTESEPELDPTVEERKRLMIAIPEEEEKDVDDSFEIRTKSEGWTPRDSETNSRTKRIWGKLRNWKREMVEKFSPRSNQP